SVGDWLRQIGLSPEKLTLDPLTNRYGDLVQTLQKVGYELGKTLFVANWDWRLELAPKDLTADGVISGVSGANLTDATFSYGLDYLGDALKEANEAYYLAKGTNLTEVDIVG